MKILLVNPNHNVFCRTGWFPLGMAYLGAALQDNGHEVEIIDATVKDSDEIEKSIKDNNYDIFGTGGLFTVFEQIEHYLSLNRKYHPKAVALLGGSVVTALPEIIMKRMDADIAVIGEGEATIVDIADSLAGNQDLSRINGTCTKQGDDIIVNPGRDVIRDIDALPFPAWHLFPVEHYIEQLSADIRFHNAKHRRMDLLAGRSCPFHCRFCYNILGYPVRMRSPKSIVHEIMALRETMGISFIQFMDETFVSDNKRITDMCNRLLKEKVDIQWKCQTRADTIDNETAKLMRAAGCVNIFLGIESGSDKILKNMNKRTSATTNKRAIEAIRSAGIEPETAFMFGYPGETEETINETIQFIKDMNLFVESMNCATPLPNSKLYRDAVESGLIENQIEYLRYISHHHMANISFNFTAYDDDYLKELYDRTIAELRMSSMQANPLNILEIREKSDDALLKIECSFCNEVFWSQLNSFSIAPVLRCAACNRSYWVDPRSLPNIGAIIKRLDQRLRDARLNQRRRLMIYGAGLHTLYLTQTVSFSGFEICGYIDADPNKQGRKFLGAPVFAPEEIASILPDIIIISTPTFEDEVYANIAHLVEKGINIIKIYARSKPISQYQLLNRFTSPCLEASPS